MQEPRILELHLGDFYGIRIGDERSIQEIRFVHPVLRISCREARVQERLHDKRTGRKLLPHLLDCSLCLLPKLCTRIAECELAICLLALGGTWRKYGKCSLCL